jgi:hypothetical protein
MTFGKRIDDRAKGIERQMEGTIKAGISRPRNDVVKGEDEGLIS